MTWRVEMETLEARGELSDLGLASVRLDSKPYPPRSFALEKPTVA